MQYLLMIVQWQETHSNAGKKVLKIHPKARNYHKIKEDN